MLYIIGLGLSSIDDISVAGFKIVNQCKHVFIDAYTCVLTHDAVKVSDFFGKPIRIADREFVEQDPLIIDLAAKEEVAFLVVGDPLGATTHCDLIIRAINAKIPYKIIHNASIITGIGCSGLQLYRFGETVSIPLWDEFGHPDSFYEKISANYIRGLHTLCLLDIKVKEKSLDNLLHERNIYEPARFMSCSQAAFQILEAGDRIKKRLETPSDHLDDCSPNSIYFINPHCLVVCVARVGADNQSIVVTTIEILKQSLLASSNLYNPLLTAIGEPLHSISIPGKLHPMEVEMLTARLVAPKNYSNENGTALPFLFPVPDFDNLQLDEIATQQVHTMFEEHNNMCTTAATFIK